MTVYCAWSPWTNTCSSLFENIESIKGKILPQDAKLLVLPGGEDINPALYNEMPDYTRYNEFRDYVEVGFLKQALSRGVKILGICRGHQLLNAYLGGKLIQDLYTEGIHHEGVHTLEWLDSTLEKEICLPSVNSLHHQGYNLDTISPVLTPIALHKGIVEFASGENIISTQFHPEMMGQRAESLKNYIYKWLGKE